MSRDCTICLKEPCKTVDDLDLYNLESPIFPFVLNCPPGSTCNPANVALLACCDEDVPVTIPQNANDSEALALLQAALADCARKQLFCGELSELPTPGSPIIVYFNDSITQSSTCPDGSVFRYTVRAGTVVGLSRASANAAAGRLARTRAVEHRVCLSALDGAICLDVAYSRTIKATGRFVAQFPATDFWTLLSGTLPTGLSFSGGFTTNGAIISGTPTAVGTYTFTIRFVVSTFGSDGYGDYMEKTYELKVVGITTATPLPDYTTGQFYSEALDISGSYDIDLETWSISSGNLPDGLTLSKRLISGTPTPSGQGFAFTVQVAFTVDVILKNGLRGFKAIICSKPFTIEAVSSIPEPFAYWKMEESAGLTRLDSVGDADLALSGTGTDGQISGVIDNGAELDGTGDVKRLGITHYAPLLHDGNGFTLCGWAMLPSYDGFPHLADFVELTYTDNVVLFDFFQFFAPADSFPGPVSKFKFGFYRNSGAQTIETGQDYDFGVWYFFRAWYDPADQKMHLQINNGFTLDSSAFSLTPGTTTAFFEIISARNILRIDELGYWKEVLTDEAATALYNSGSGTRPPLP